MSHGKYKAFSKDSPGAEKVLKVEYTWKKKKKNVPRYKTNVCWR